MTNAVKEQSPQFYGLVLIRKCLKIVPKKESQGKEGKGNGKGEVEELVGTYTRVPNETSNTC